MEYDKIMATGGRERLKSGRLWGGLEEKATFPFPQAPFSFWLSLS